MPLEKLVLALIIASRKLRHYFDAHPIKVLTSSPIKVALRKVDLIRRTEKWSVELGRFHIEYEPRMAIKGQVLANFVMKFTSGAEVEPTNTLPAPTEGQDIEMSSAEQLMLKYDQHLSNLEKSTPMHGYSSLMALQQQIHQVLA